MLRIAAITKKKLSTCRGVNLRHIKYNKNNGETLELKFFVIIAYFTKVELSNLVTHFENKQFPGNTGKLAPELAKCVLFWRFIYDHRFVLGT